MTIEQIKKVALEYATKGPTILAQELGVSRQAVNEVANRLRKNGVNIPVLRKYVSYKKIVAELKQERPDLF